jgi:hypothetical protein
VNRSQGLHVLSAGGWLRSSVVDVRLTVLRIDISTLSRKLTRTLGFSLSEMYFRKDIGACMYL